jgi:hypothetical protein
MEFTYWDAYFDEEPNDFHRIDQYFAKIITLIQIALSKKHSGNIQDQIYKHKVIYPEVTKVEVPISEEERRKKLAAQKKAAMSKMGVFGFPFGEE